MAYSIFISHTQVDKRIAEAVKRVINDAFEGSVQFFLAAHDLGGGDEWKRLLKERLQDCNAIISLITDQSASKPWIFIEWSAFWLHDKHFYVLMTEDVRVASLVEPMRDRQATTLTDPEQVRAFFRSISRNANHTKGTPFEYVDDFIIAIKQAIAERDQELATQSYARFRESVLDLPRDDSEKRKIAEWFYRQNEIDPARRITYEIRDDLIKAEMASQLIRVGDLENARIVIETVRAADRLGFTARALIDYGYLDSRILRAVIEDIAGKNQAEMRTLCIYLISHAQLDTDLFDFITHTFSNMAELRKVAEHLIENQFDRTSPEKLYGIVTHIAAKNQREAEKVISLLIDTNLELVHQYLEAGLITNAVSRARLQKVLDSK